MVPELKPSEYMLSVHNAKDHLLTILPSLEFLELLSCKENDEMSDNMTIDVHGWNGGGSCWSREKSASRGSLLLRFQN